MSMLTEVQKIILTCLLGPEDPQAFARECRRIKTARFRAKNPAACRETTARSRAKHPDAYKARQRKYHLERLYGLSIVEHQKMMDKQSGLCAICGGLMKSPHVDHNHATGKVRGLLCQGCNTGIGNLQDNPTICAAAVEYLKKGI